MKRVVIADVEPGKWTASWRAISSLDGHPTDGNFAFTVGGEEGCSHEDSTDEETDHEAADGDDVGSSVQAGGPSNGSGPAPADEGSGLPVVPIVSGAAALIVLAFIARSAGAR